MQPAAAVWRSVSGGGRGRGKSGEMVSGNWRLETGKFGMEAGGRVGDPSPGIAMADSRSFQLDPALGSPRSEPRSLSLPSMPCLVHHFTAVCRSMLRSRDPVDGRRKALLHKALRASGSAAPRIDIVSSTPGAACYLVAKVWNQESSASSPPLVPPPQALGPHCPQSPNTFLPEANRAASFHLPIDREPKSPLIQGAGGSGRVPSDWRIFGPSELWTLHQSDRTPAH